MKNDLPALDWQKASDGLLPAVIQDTETGQVLMLGYMNEEALRQTLETKRVTFYSRSKRRLWKKGEISGNTLELQALRSDCDGDALLLQVRHTGPTCHRGTRSCFGDDHELPLETIGLLMRVIQERSLQGTENSYTKKLLTGGLGTYGAKVFEEAEELVRAAKEEGSQRTVEEAADLVYHFLVFLKGQNIPFDAIVRELRKRRN